MRNIYIVGFMGTGKTTVGRILSGKLKKNFVEMDDIIKEREGLSIVDIFEQKGEARFRELEKNLLGELSAQTDLVVSCGGGLICEEGNLKILKDSGIVFNLKATPAAVYARTKKYTHRPLLNVDNVLKEIEHLLAKRNDYYNRADYSVSTDGISAEEVADRIIAILEKSKE